MRIFFNRSDEEIEKMWDEEIVQKGVFACVRRNTYLDPPIELISRRAAYQ